MSDEPEASEASEATITDYHVAVIFGTCAGCGKQTAIGEPKAVSMALQGQPLDVACKCGHRIKAIAAGDSARIKPAPNRKARRAQAKRTKAGIILP